MGEQECLRILLVENGSVLDLVETFLRKLGNRRVPAGSVILLFSASFLQQAGLELYTAELVQAEARIHAVIGKETIFQPLPPILLGGTEDSNLVRAMIELATWSDTYFAGNDYLEKSSGLAIKVINESGSGSREDIEARRYALPAKSENTKRVWASEGAARAMPCALKPLTPNLETEFVRGLVAEMREKWALDLDPAPKLDRSLGPQQKAKRKVDVLIVGSSNAQRLAAAFRQKNKHCDVLTSPGWIVSRITVERLAVKLRQTLIDEDPELVILQIMDNSTFFARAEDGSRNLPKRGLDEKFHVEGELLVCGRETQISHFDTIRPLFDAVGKKKCLWVAPFPRFLLRSCCNDPGHVTNINSRYYREDMEEQLDRYKWGMKEHIRSLGRKNFKVLDPNIDLRSMAEHEVWGEDPVHPLEAAYEKMAAGAITLSLTFTPTHPPFNQNNRGPQVPRGGQTGGLQGGQHGGDRGRGRRGRGTATENYRGSDNRRGRQYDPASEGRGRGGHHEYRARPY
jgi:hypothetical protein